MERQTRCCGVQNVYFSIQLSEVGLDRHFAALVELFWPSKTTWLPAQGNRFQLDALVDRRTIR